MVVVYLYLYWKWNYCLQSDRVWLCTQVSTINWCLEELVQMAAPDQ